ncbi:MAG: FliA/WhiG family RNA polymerase sigma factor [Planctomycetes bacterium]|nr:FliA/WhiG family RNA polymerase sigma factor [Planctomycetota bacterium]
MATTRTKPKTRTKRATKFNPRKHRLVGKTRIDDPELELAWIEYKETGKQDLRNHLMEQYLSLVKYIAERILVKLPQNVELDDLYSAGIFGLMDAIDGFDLERGVKFETYCTTRIRGSILDALRALDWVPRIVRNKAHRLDDVYQELENELGRTPTAPELADRLELSPEDFEAMLREASAVTMVSLTDQSNDEGESKTLRKIDILEDKRGVDPESEALKREVTEFITKFLSRKERLIVLLYYFEDLTMREIGATLGLSESRVCQLHSRIVLRLRNQLKKYQRDLVR